MNGKRGWVSMMLILFLLRKALSNCATANVCKSTLVCMWWLWWTGEIQLIWDTAMDEREWASSAILSGQPDYPAVLQLPHPIIGCQTNQNSETHIYICIEICALNMIASSLQTYQTWSVCSILYTNVTNLYRCGLVKKKKRQIK